MKNLLFIALLATATSCSVKLPFQVYEEPNYRQLNDSERKIDAVNPANKFVVSFIGIYKDDIVRLLVDGKEVYNEKLNNENKSDRQFLASYMGDKPKQNLQIFINDQSVSFVASKIENKRYVTIDKDNSKKIFLSKSPVFRGADNFYDDPNFTRQKTYREQLGDPNKNIPREKKNDLKETIGN